MCCLREVAVPLRFRSSSPRFSTQRSAIIQRSLAVLKQITVATSLKATVQFLASLKPVQPLKSGVKTNGKSSATSSSLQTKASSSHGQGRLGLLSTVHRPIPERGPLELFSSVFHTVRGSQHTGRGISSHVFGPGSVHTSSSGDSSGSGQVITSMVPQKDMFLPVWTKVPLCGFTSAAQLDATEDDEALVMPEIKTLTHHWSSTTMKSLNGLLKCVQSDDDRPYVQTDVRTGKTLLNNL